MPDFDPASRATVEAVSPYTMTSPERLFATCEAIRYVNRCGIPGAIVECGVWAGGSMMAAARTLIEVGDHTRDLHLFDTFAGMSQPTDGDRDASGRAAAALVDADERHGGVRCYASIDDVRSNLARTRYPRAHCHLVKGPAEATTPDRAPQQIAVLRLDTDWYESTRHASTWSSA